MLWTYLPEEFTGKGMRGATFRQRVSPKTQRMSLISRERVHDMREMRASLKGCREHPERLRTGMLQEEMPKGGNDDD